jgi:phospholipid/cholesterol/gamma-HCH transport system substrate-binding protein
MEIRARYVLIGLFALTVIVGAFGFIYWLNASGGFGERATYRVRFQSSVAGLFLGSDVLFNGMRVGEVTDLRISNESPSDVIATIEVVADMPVRSDTRVGLQYGGLTGTASIALQGGTAGAPPLERSANEPPLLTADPSAAQDWTQAAREAFGQVNGLLSANSEAIKDTIENIQEFSGALGRNAERVDKIVAGLERMTAQSRPGPNATIYDLTAAGEFASNLSIPATTLVVPLPTSVVSMDTPRFLVGTATSEAFAFDDAKWSDNIPTLVRAKIIESFENAGYPRVGTDMQGLPADRQLLIDVRAFRVSTRDKPVGEVDFSVKVISSEGVLLAARTFHAEALLAGKIEPDKSAAAINQAFQQVAADLVAWVLTVP